MKQKKQNWREWGMNPGKRYYAVGLGRPEEAEGAARVHLHYFTTRDGLSVMFVFSTAEKAQRFIRKSIEEKPQAYMDLLEDARGEVPAGLRKGEYTLLAETPNGLAEMGLQMGIQGMVLDPGPGENHPIPLRPADSVIDPEGNYYVLHFGQGLEKGGFYHYANRRGERVLPIFTSSRKAEEFVCGHNRKSTGHLNDLRQRGSDHPLTPKRPVAGQLLVGVDGSMRVGKLTPVVETLATIVSGLNVSLLAIDPGELPSRYTRIRPHA